VAKQRRAPDERADKRDRHLARLILRTALPVNRRDVATATAGSNLAAWRMRSSGQKAQLRP
jgi:hypothetical protein